MKHVLAAQSLALLLALWQATGAGGALAQPGEEIGCPVEYYYGVDLGGEVVYARDTRATRSLVWQEGEPPVWDGLSLHAAPGYELERVEGWPEQGGQAGPVRLYYRQGPSSLWITATAEDGAYAPANQRVRVTGPSYPQGQEFTLSGGALRLDGLLWGPYSVVWDQGQDSRWTAVYPDGAVAQVGGADQSRLAIRLMRREGRLTLSNQAQPLLAEPARFWLSLRGYGDRVLRLPQRVRSASLEPQYREGALEGYWVTLSPGDSLVLGGLSSGVTYRAWPEDGGPDSMKAGSLDSRLGTSLGWPDDSRGLSVRRITQGIPSPAPTQVAIMRVVGRDDRVSGETDDQRVKVAALAEGQRHALAQLPEGTYYAVSLNSDARYQGDVTLRGDTHWGELTVIDLREPEELAWRE